MNLAFLPHEPTTAAYLRTLPAIRERCERVFEIAKRGGLQYFDYHQDKEDDVAAFCVDIINRDYGTDYASIPPHGRWRHLDAGRSRIDPLISSWKTDPKETCKRLIDLFLVSVLLDAGAGNTWVYREGAGKGEGEANARTFSRSEGLGVASVHMFEAGFFSGDGLGQPCRVDATGLSRITAEKTAQAMQVSASNPMVGIEGRASLLYHLGSALRSNPAFFGQDARPGNLIDFLESESILDGASRRVPIAALWHVLIDGLSSIWPASRTSLGGVSLGDVWPCALLKSSSPGDDLVPFHKLTGWITYSLVEPIERILHWKFNGMEDLTGLPEYRNGGLLVDLGVLSLKPNSIPVVPKSGLPRVPPSHPAIVEWRAMTVIEIDRIADAIRKKLGLSPSQLTLPQILESATWKGGREIARRLRPDTGGPPIDIESDGTVF